MKNIFNLFIGLFISIVSLQAQAPQAFQYQAVARNSAGNAIAMQNVSIRISILQGSPTGSIIYVETHNPTTNNYGLFTLNIGTGTINNGTFNTISWRANNHFIKVEMDETGGFAYQDMGTTQLLSVPYALHAETVTDKDDADANPNNELQALSILGNQLTISNGNTVTLPSNNGGGTLDAAYDFGGAGAGRTINVDAGEIQLNSSVANSSAMRINSNNTGTGLISNSNAANNTFSAIQANTNSTSNVAAAIIGNSSAEAWGIAGQVLGTGTAEAALYGSNLRTNGGHGVLGIGFNGVVGETGQSTGHGLYGENFDNISPWGNAIGVGGKGYYGVVGEDMYNGAVAGAYGVFSNGNLGASGTKTFKIDHPTDPENKYLRHFSIESDQVLNVYRGTTTFDANGEAVISLPDYFSAINKNETYQLTPIGAFMQLYVKEKVNENNKFVVSGGIAGKEVSWSIYAERNDLYLQKNPEQRATELDKRPQEKGKYLMPELYNAGPEKAIFQKQKTEKERPVLNIK